MFNKNRDTGTYSEVNVVQNTIDKANSASLLDIFHSYSINIDYNHAACCPFPFHKGGQERSASFHYYKDTNSFYCFGCKTGGGAVDFVSRYEDLNRYNAALAIVNDFETNKSNVSERPDNHYKLYLEFSHLVREFIMLNKDNEKALAYAEYVCSAFDNVRSKYVLDSTGLNIIYAKLKRKLADFK